MQPNLAAQANQAAAQGQQQLASDKSQSAASKAQYGDFSNQANTANQNVQNYTQYMQGAGSAGNQYHNELGTQLGQLGYDPAQMTAARGNLNQATGALSAYSDFANTGASKFGLNAGGFAAANAGALGGLNNNIAAQQGVVNGLSSLYGQAQTGANQFTGNVVQGEHETLGGLQDVYTNAANQRDQAASMMNFYDNLAQQQGGMNSQMASQYAAAQQAYSSAQAAIAQAGYLISQTTGQNIKNQGDQATLAGNAAAAQAKAQQQAAAKVQQYNGISANDGSYNNAPVKNNGQGVSLANF